MYKLEIWLILHQNNEDLKLTERTDEQPKHIADELVWINVHIVTHNTLHNPLN